VANRYFFVPDPVTAVIEGAPHRTALAMLHPGDAAKGTRALPFEGTAVLPGSEIVSEASMVRLKDLFNVNIAWNGTTPSFAYGGDALADARAAKAHIIQWLPAQHTLPCTLLTMEGEIRGVCEPAVTKEQGNVVQFERIGFVRIDAATKDGILAYFAHT
jgi:glutamyl-tRNA synthetase